MESKIFESGIAEWFIAGGSTPEKQKVALMSTLFSESCMKHRIPQEAVQTIFDYCFSNFARPSLPSFLKGWDQVKDEYYRKKHSQNYRHDETEVSPIAGLSLDNYMYFCECVLRRLGFKHSHNFPAMARQIELFEQKGLPEKPHRYESIIVEHHARGVQKFGGEWLMRKWSAVLAQHRDNRGID